MIKDNWQHRSLTMKCMTCMWFVPKVNSKIGRCRRHAPTMSGFPAVYDSDWCGDHKIDESTAIEAQTIATEDLLDEAKD